MRTRRIGQALYVRDRGQWRPASASEEMDAEAGGFGLGVASGALDLGQMAMQVGQGMMAGQMAASGAPVMPDTATALDPLAEEARQRAAGVARFQPGAVMAGQMAPGLVGFNPLAAGRSVGGSIVDRIRQVKMASRAGRGGALEMTLGERTGSPIVNRLEASVQSMGGFDPLAQRRRVLLNRAGARAIGQEADELTPEVLDAASRDIGAGIEGIFAGRQFDVPETLAATLGELPGKSARIKLLLPEGPGPIAGEKLANLRAALADRAKAYMGENTALADDYRAVIEALDDSVAAGLSPEAVQTHRLYRQQWKNLLTLESVPELRASGNLTPRQLGNALTRSYGSSFTRGRGTGHAETDELMGLTKQLTRLRQIPDSGTATRLAPIIGATAGAAQGEDPSSALANAALYGAAGYAVPLVLGRASLAASRRLVK